MSEIDKPENNRPLPDQLTCDVAIVGYGPVGITAAALLAQFGHRVIVVERFPQRYDKPRAGHFDGETMRTFQTLGIAREIELLARKMNSYELVSSGNETLAALKQGEAGSGWHKGYLFHQPEIEDCIDERGRALGVQVLMNTTALDIVQDTDGAKLIVCDSDDLEGARCTIHAAYIIGADGAKSYVREQIGANKRNLGFPELEDLAIDFEYFDPDQDVPLLGEAGHILADGHVVTFGRWTGGRMSRVEVCKIGTDTREYLEREETAWKFLKHFDLTPEMGRIARNSTYTFECSVSKPWRNSRVFLMGDAAHTTVPMLGQGVCAGIRDAINLGWKLDAVLTGRASPSLLDTYESERAPQAEGVIQMAMAVANAAMPAAEVSADQQREALNQESAPPPQMSFPAIGSGIVRASDKRGASPADGRPALQARVGWQGRVDLLDEFLKPGWRLISRHPVPDDILTKGQLAMMKSLNLQKVHVSRAAGTDHFIDVDGDYEAWFNATGQKAFLVRPDHYTFGAAATIAEVPHLLDAAWQALSAHGWLVEQEPQPAE